MGSCLCIQRTANGSADKAWHPVFMGAPFQQLKGRNCTDVCRQVNRLTHVFTHVQACHLARNRGEALTCATGAQA